MKFKPRDYVVFGYDYQMGNMIIYKGTGAWVDKYRDNMVELKISGLGFLVPENFLMQADDYRELVKNE